MALDCLMFDNITLDEVRNCNYDFPILINSKVGYIKLTKYGQYFDSENAKCVIFPKGKTTWDDFVPPYKFKDGDILSNGISISIHNGYEGEYYYGCYVAIGNIDLPNYFVNRENNKYVTKENIRLATEEEKQKLFDAIEANGYKWNPETKTLEMLPKFKVGDRIVHKENNACVPILITNVSDEFYFSNTESSVGVLSISEQDNYELVPSKFDITTLKPFDKVLVRDNDNQMWTVDMFSFYNRKNVYPFSCVGHSVNQCIPYEGNEYLLGTTDDCDSFYKTWK